MNFLILDATLGSKRIYHGWDKKINENLVGIDIRRGNFSYKTKSMWTTTKVDIEPTVLADMTFLPFRDHSFNLIVFDPPHTEFGLNSFMNLVYGSWTQTHTIRTLRLCNEEFSRVLRPPGILILKVQPKSFPLYETLLKNFCFFLPIQTKRARGLFMKKEKEQDAALWAIAYCKVGVECE